MGHVGVQPTRQPLDFMLQIHLQHGIASGETFLKIIAYIPTQQRHTDQTAQSITTKLGYFLPQKALL